MDNKKTEKQRITRMKVLSGIMLAVIGSVMGFTIASIVLDGEETVSTPLYYKLLNIPLIIIAYFVVIGIHELGHVLAGWSQKFVFRFITVGPFMLEREAGQLKFKWNKQVNLLGGLALSLPNDQYNLVKRYSIFIAGGPIASIIYGLLMLAGTTQLSTDNELLHWYLLDSFFIINCLLSLCIGIATLIPLKEGGFSSDGGKLLNFAKGGLSANVEATFIRYLAMATSGIRPSMMDPKPAEELLKALPDSDMKAYFHSILYNHYQDIKELDKAAYHLDEYLKEADNIPKGYVTSLYLEKAWFEARYNKNLEKALEYFHKEKFGVMIPKVQILRTEAAIALEKKDIILASEKIKQALIELPKLMDKGAIISEKECLEEMLSEICALEESFENHLAK
jgi:hypothetical protein